MSRDKIGRNALCPCGSGKKYKKCHLDNSSEFVSDSKTPSDLDISILIERKKAIEELRRKQQGLGKGIISTVFQEHRFVAVGNKIHYSKNWNTFHDFLLYYIVHVFQKSWFESEMKTSRDKMHPTVKWLLHIQKSQKSISSTEKIKSMEMTGVVYRYLLLAYNLYLLSHNTSLQEIMIDRLKKVNGFEGAYYETVISGIFYRAGFDVELEDEQDSSTSHCEFIATHTETSKQFGVEVKNRDLNKDGAVIGNQLYKALRKKCDHERIVFINLNKDDDNEKSPFYWDDAVLNEIQGKETSLTINGTPAPPAYLFISNIPISDSDISSKMPLLVHGFKKPDLILNGKLEIRRLIEMREEHAELFHLMRSIETYNSIPSTFDGSLPELSLKGKRHDFVVGNKLAVDIQESQIVGVLKMATVNSKKHTVFCVLTQDDGTDKIVEVPMTKEEIEAYDTNPNDFIVQTDKPRNIEKGDYLAFYDFSFDSYRNTSKEKLGELLGLDAETVKRSTHKELVKEMSIRNTISVIKVDEANS